MVRHNNMLTAVHLGKDWQEKVKTWFNQPGRKHRRRMNRQRKARLCAPNPTHKLRPIVRGMTNKYNNKIRLGRGFTLDELKKAGLNSIPYAKSIGIAIDLRRKDTSAETQTLNVNRIKEYLAKIILYPRKTADKKPIVKEATEEQLKTPEAKEQNTSKCIIALPKEECGYTFTQITDAMKKDNVYKTQRTERKTANGFYRRMEERKNKAAAKKK